MSNRLYIRHIINTPYVKTGNQELVTFNEPLIYFYLIDVSFFVCTFFPWQNVDQK